MRNRQEMMYGVRGILLVLFLLPAGNTSGQLNIVPGKPVPPHTVWWVSPPPRTEDVHLLWRFDAMQDDEFLDSLLDAVDDAALLGLSPVGGPSAETIEPVTQGNTHLTEDGRFGRGLALAADGTVQASPIQLARLSAHFMQASLEFFIRLDAPPDTDAILLDLGDNWRLQWVDGKLAFVQGRTVHMQHPLRLQTGHWHHVALHIRDDNSIRLLVDGNAASWTGRLGSSGNTLVFGEGLACTLDEVLVTIGPRHLYAKRDPQLPDPDANRPFVHAPPYFLSSQTLLWQAFMDVLEHDGVRGGALAAARASDSVVLGPADVLAGSQGSIEFWFQPMDWNNFYRSILWDAGIQWLPLLQIRNSDNPRQAHTVLSAGQSAGGQHFTNKTPFTPFHPGRWVHVVASWGPFGGIFINGERQAFPQIALNRRIPEAAFKEGWELVALPTDTLFDQIMVHPLPLHTNEVWNAWRRYWPDGLADLRTLPQIEATYTYRAKGMQPDTQQLSVQLRCLPIDEVMPSTATYSLRDQHGTVFVPPQTITLDEFGYANPVFDIDLPFGMYTAGIQTYAADGSELLTTDLAYHWEKPEWYDNALGRERFVPPPWSPMTLDPATQTVGVWGRDVALQPNGLPAAITALERNLLAAPLRIHGLAGGKPFAIQGGSLQFTETSDDLLSWQAAVPASAPDAPSATISAWMEYDGLMYYTVTLEQATGTGATVVDRLWVDIPMSEADTSQMIANGGAHYFRASHHIHFIPQGEGPVWNSAPPHTGMLKGISYGSFIPQIWLGGDHIGLSISGENDKGWTPDNDVPAQEILREDDIVMFRMNVITRPVTIKDSREFTFILLPTPAKPLPDTWRGWNRTAGGNPMSKYHNIDDFDGYAMTGPPGENIPLTFRLEPHSWEAAQAHAATGRRRAGPHNPVLKYINYSWPSLGPSLRPWMDGIGAGGRIAFSREVEDYYVWIMHEYIRRGLIDGIYIDDVSLGLNMRLDVSAYDWEHPETGKIVRRPGTNTMGFRRFLQRIYKILVMEGKHPRIVPHMTFIFELPAFSFCDAILNGEARDIAAFSEKDYIDAFPEREMRIMGPSEKWGTAHFFKWLVIRDPPGTQVPRKLPADRLASWFYRQNRAGDAWLPHFDLWYFWRERSRGDLAGSMIEFGMDDPELDFIPYWESGEHIRISGVTNRSDFIAGIWTKPDKALVLVSNLSHEDQTVTLSPDLNALFGAGHSQAHWKCVDGSLMPPPRPLENIGQAARDASDISLSGSVDLGFLNELEQDLDGRPEDHERERLRPQISGNNITLVVRKRDYRILELSIP